VRDYRKLVYSAKPLT